MNKIIAIDVPVIVDCQNFFLYEEGNKSSYLPSLRNQISQSMIATMVDGVKGMITGRGVGQAIFTLHEHTTLETRKNLTIIKGGLVDYIDDERFQNNYFCVTNKDLILSLLSGDYANVELDQVLEGWKLHKDIQEHSYPLSKIYEMDNTYYLGERGNHVAFLKNTYNVSDSNPNFVPFVINLINENPNVRFLVGGAVGGVCVHEMLSCLVNKCNAKNVALVDEATLHFDETSKNNLHNYCEKNNIEII